MAHQQHIFIFPLMAHGHMIPMLELAKLFTSQGVKTTVIITPAFADSVKTAQKSNSDLGLEILEFPPKGSGCPDHIVSINQATEYRLHTEFNRAVNLLQEPFEKLMQELNPSCIVSDMFLPWTVNSAEKFGIPRLVFHVTSFFSLCVTEQMRRHEPFKNVSSDSELFSVPDLPDKLTYVRTQIQQDETETAIVYDKLMKECLEAESRSYGAVINSFYEIEPNYADYYRKVLQRKAWHFGPSVLCNREDENKAHRGKQSTVDTGQCLKWLDSKKDESVIFVSFGSLVTFTPSQLHEMAIGLEDSGHDFIWVIRNCENGVLPQGFEEKMEGKGLIIRGWAPQVSILEHPAIGGFVTHCGWNSVLEAVCAGVPLVTWPVSHDQFYIEKLVNEVLKIGVSVGNKKWERMDSEGVSSEALAKAVRRVIVGEEAKEMRRRVKEYKEMARKAVEKDGSSGRNLSALIEELKNLGTPTQEVDDMVRI